MHGHDYYINQPFLFLIYVYQPINIAVSITCKYQDHEIQRLNLLVFNGINFYKGD